MKVFFDVDYTILSIDYGMRRGTVDTFQRLVEDGHQLHLWSGHGPRLQVVRDFKLEPYVSGVYQKPLFDYARRLGHFGIESVPDFVIDDFPEIVSVFGGYRVPYFYSKSVDDDDEMEDVYRTICEVGAQGWSSHRSWRPRHAEFERMLSGEYSGRQ
jgi:hypothetical protein